MTERMRAMVLERLSPGGVGETPLRLAQVSRPDIGSGEILVRVTVCGVCHTELDEIEGRTPPGSLPVIPGHQVVGVVEEIGDGVVHLARGDRAGAAWIYSACGRCAFCLSDRENLCPEFGGTGRDADGGYAEFMRVRADFAYAIPPSLSDSEAAPLLCAGALGYRALRLAGVADGQALGLTGFGASGHLVLQTARHLYPNARVHVFARRVEERAFALELGATWAGATEDEPPEPMNAIIDTTPAWRPVVASLGHLARGGRLVINAIRKEDADRSALLELSYERDLWLEKEVKSVANVSRQDVREFLDIAAAIPLRPEVREYPLEDANHALSEIRRQEIRGAKVLRIG